MSNTARERYLSLTPAHYTWWLHLTIDLGLPALIIAFAISQIDALTAAEALALPIGFLAANIGEYLLHRYPMHRPLWPRMAYDRHAVVHHSVFTHESMGLDSMRDLRWILFPAFTVPGLVLLMIPIAWSVGALVSTNAGWLALIVMASYYSLYEFLHTAYHLPTESWLGRRRLIAYLRRVHQTHHDPTLMSRWNFNVTFPVTDAPGAPSIRIPRP